MVVPASLAIFLGVAMDNNYWDVHVAMDTPSNWDINVAMDTPSNWDIHVAMDTPSNWDIHTS